MAEALFSQEKFTFISMAFWVPFSPEWTSSNCSVRPFSIVKSPSNQVRAGYNLTEDSTENLSSLKKIKICSWLITIDLLEKTGRAIWQKLTLSSDTVTLEGSPVLAPCQWLNDALLWFNLQRLNTSHRWRTDIGMSFDVDYNFVQLKFQCHESLHFVIALTVLGNKFRLQRQERDLAIKQVAWYRFLAGCVGLLK